MWLPRLVEQGLRLGASFYGARFTAVRMERHEICPEGAYQGGPDTAALVRATATGERGTGVTAGVQCGREAHTIQRHGVLAGGFGQDAASELMRDKEDEGLAVNPGRAFAAQVIPTERGFQIVSTHF